MAGKEIDSIVLVTTETWVSQPGIAHLLEKLGDRIKLILISSAVPGGGRNKNKIEWIRESYKYTGAKFLAAQMANWVLHPLLAGISLSLRRVLRQPLRTVPLELAAARRKIPVRKVSNVNSPEIHELIRGMSPDLVLSFYNIQIFKNPFIALPRAGILGVHHGLIPEARGRHPVPAALIGGVPLGVTIHTVEDERIDMGRIHTRSEYVAARGESILCTERKLLQIGAGLVPAVIRSIEDGSAVLTPVTQKGFYLSRPTRAQVDSIRAAGTPLISLRKFFAHYLT